MSTIKDLSIKNLQNKIYDLEVENGILKNKIEEYKSYEQHYKNQIEELRAELKAYENRSDIDAASYMQNCKY